MVEATTGLSPSAARSHPRGGHIVDVLIEERAPNLAGNPAWPVLRPLLYAILNYSKARKMADDIARMDGAAALEHISALLRLSITVQRGERIAREGPFVLLANHPSGISDGIALFDVLGPVRPDHMFYANSDAHRVCPRFDEVLIPVEWVPGKRTRERTRLTLKMTAEAFAAGRPLVIFPAGRIARMREGLLTDPEWQTTAVSLARKHHLPVVPVHVDGPYSFLFHFFNRFSAELRDITLFHELLNKEQAPYRITFGPAIDPETLAGDAAVMTRRVKHYVERVLSADPDAAFDPEGPECAWRDPPSLSVGAPAQPPEP